MSFLSEMEREWVTIQVPGTPAPTPFATYVRYRSEELPTPPADLATLTWLARAAAGFTLDPEEAAFWREEPWGYLLVADSFAEFAWRWWWTMTSSTASGLRSPHDAGGPDLRPAVWQSEDHRLATARKCRHALGHSNSGPSRKPRR
jgi:hypothetical protein